MQRYVCTGAIAVLILGLASAEASEMRELRLPDKIDISIEVEPAPGDTVLLWLPSGIPAASNDADLARKIGALGIEVWRPDLLGARFLPNLESSLEQIPDSDVAVLLEAARVSGKHVALLASARASVLALRAARHWQTLHPQDTTLTGAILLHPALYLGPPEPGREAEFHPVVSATHLPLVVIQPEKYRGIFAWRRCATRSSGPVHRSRCVRWLVCATVTISARMQRRRKMPKRRVCQPCFANRWDSCAWIKNGWRRQRRPPGLEKEGRPCRRRCAACILFRATRRHPRWRLPASMDTHTTSPTTADARC